MPGTYPGTRLGEETRESVAADPPAAMGCKQLDVGVNQLAITIEYNRVIINCPPLRI